MSNKPDFLHPQNPPSDPLAWLIKWAFIFALACALAGGMGAFVR